MHRIDYTVCGGIKSGVAAVTEDQKYEEHCMKKKYETPEVYSVKFDKDYILTDSTVLPPDEFDDEVDEPEEGTNTVPSDSNQKFMIP